jgi:hypothetical protein
MTDKEKDNSQEEKPNTKPSIPIETNPPIIKNSENTNDTTKTSENITRETIKQVNLVTEKPILIKESRFAKRGFVIQTILAGVGLITLIGFIIFNITQHNDSVSALRLAKKSSDSAYSATKHSLAISESTLAVVKNSAANTEKFSKIEVRTYLNYVGEENHSFIPGHPIKIRLNFLNSGKTPAYDIRSRSFIKTGTGIFPQEIQFLKMSNIKASENKGIVVGAGQDYFLEATADWILPDSNYIYKSRYTLYVYGEILYKDKFRENHYTHFGLAYRTSINQFMFEQNFFDAD